MPKRKRKPHLSKKARRRKRQRIAYLSGLFLLCILLVCGISYGLLYRYVNKTEEDKISNHIYIGKVELSGMTKEQAKDAVEKKMAEYRQLKVTLKVGEQTAKTTLGDLGIEMKDVDKLIEEAVSYGKEGSVWKRFRQIRKLGKNELVLDDTYQLDGESAKSVLTEKALPMETRAVDATITHKGSGFEITDEAAGNKIKIEESLANLEKYLNEKWKYKEITLELVQESEAPSVTRADLESIRDELGSYSTQAGYGDRVKNIRRAAELLNGTLLMPGEELSVEQTLAPYTEENGYVAGSAYENGQVVQNIGGGLCQVSTTLYNAVLYSELEVTERCAHSMIVNYVEPSRDAAIAEGVKDFKFKNNYDTPILIEGYVDSNNKVWFYIYGKDTRAEGHSVEFESETLERTEYSKKYVEDPDSAIGSMEEEGTAINGRTAWLWKVVYETGQEVSRDVINNSTYKASEVTVKVGTASGSAEASKLIRTAIQSQNEDKIREAVSEARTLQSGSGEGE